jgi:hypothetical protein
MTTREIHQTDGVAWLKAHPLPPGHAIITSLPDSSEVPALGFDGWRGWFIDAVKVCLDACPDDSAALFFQTDVKRDGAWIDKGFLCQLGAERAGARLLWHKVVCRAPPGTITFGRPSWAHLLAFSRGLRAEPARSTTDVIPRLGEMTWGRAMGVEACVAACRFLLDCTSARTVVDPFCGLGTALAVANALGMNGVGVELSRKRAEKARTLTVRLQGPVTQ